MTSIPGAVDVNEVISDLQKLVVSLKDDTGAMRVQMTADRLNRSVAKRNGDTSKVGLPDFLKGASLEGERTKAEARRQRTRQELDQENRKLRAIHEEAQWTLLLVMNEHRRIMQELFTGSTPSPTDCCEAEIADMRADEADGHRELFAQLAIQMSGMMDYEKQKGNIRHQKIDRLRTENEVLRVMLDSEIRTLDVESLIDKVENRTPVASPNTSVIYVPPKKDNDRNSQYKDDNLTPVKKNF